MVIKKSHNKSKKDLIIVGNGLDLASHLHSKFSDFIEIYLNKNIVHKIKTKIFNIVFNYEEDNKNEDYAYLSEINIWYIILIYSYHFNSASKWADIEKIIDIVINGNDRRFGIIDLVDHQSDAIFQINKLNSSGTEFREVLLSILQHKVSEGELKRQDIFRFLYKDLQDFEKEFSSFLFTQLKEEKSLLKYLANSRKILGLIINDPNNKTTRYDLINFNYTEPTLITILENKLEKQGIDFIFPTRLLNIHGSIYNNYLKELMNQNPGIVIGISSVGIDPSEYGYLLTKNSQKMVLDELERAITKGSEAKYRMEKGVNQIKFFGHSLNEADFPYFQSIFDFYNLYENSNLKLIFYYKKYDDRTTRDYIFEQTNSISKLIEDYGRTIDDGRNMGHGKNLFTKLQMENRISIVDIDSI